MQAKLGVVFGRYIEILKPESDKIVHALLVTLTNLVELEKYEDTCKNLIKDDNIFEKLAFFVKLNSHMNLEILFEIGQFFEIFTSKMNSITILVNLKDFVREISVFVVAEVGNKISVYDKKPDVLNSFLHSIERIMNLGNYDEGIEFVIEHFGWGSIQKMLSFYCAHKDYNFYIL